MSKKEKNVVKSSRFPLFQALVLGLVAFSALGAAKKPVDRSGAERVWVVRPEGSLQCEPAVSGGLERVKAELRKAGITAHSAETRHDGVMRIQVCGMETGNLVAVLIEERDLEKARSLGFKPEAEGR